MSDDAAQGPEPARSRLGSLADGEDETTPVVGRPDGTDRTDPPRPDAGPVSDMSNMSDMPELDEAEVRAGRGSLDFPDAAPSEEEVAARGTEGEEVHVAVDLGVKSRTRDEYEALLRDLHEPLGTPAPDPFAESARGRRDDVLEIEEEERAAGEVDEVSAEELRDLADPAVDHARSASAATDDNLFDRLGTFTRTLLDGRPITDRLKSTTLLGALLVVSAGTLVYQNDTSARALGLAPEPAEVVVDDDGFQPVWDILMSPSEQATDRVPADAGPGYRRGAMAAGTVVLEAAFEAVTDPEARLAVVSAGMAQALQRDDLEAGGRWGTRLEYIPGAEDDARAARLRQRFYERLADDAAELAPRWRQRATVEASLAEAGDWTVNGEGWTMPVAQQLQKALERARLDTPDRGGAYWEGWRDAMNQTLLAFNVKTRRMEEIVREEARLR